MDARIKEAPKNKSLFINSESDRSVVLKVLKAALETDSLEGTDKTSAERLVKRLEARQ